MKSLNTAVVWMSAAALTGALALGCGDAGGAKPDSSSKPASSGASATSSAKPTSAGSAAASSTAAVASTGGAAETAPGGAAASGESLKYMPKTCDQGRVFVNLGKLLSGDVGKAAAGMQEKLLGTLASSGKPGDDKAGKVLGTLKEGGLEPVKAARELSICAGKGDKAVVAIAMDFSGVKGKPADLFAKAMEASTGKAPKKEEVDGVTYITNDKDKVMAFVSPNVLVTGDSKDAIKAVAKGGDGAGDFGPAASFVIWAKVVPGGPGSDVDVTVKESGADYELKALFLPPGREGAEFKKDPDGAIKKFNEEITQASAGVEKSPFKAALPAIKNAKLAKEGDRVALTTTFPQTMLGELATAAASIDPKQLMHF